MLTIKILGHDCAHCDKVEEITRDALAYIGIEAEISRIADVEEITRYAISSTPGLVIDGKVVCSGRVPSMGEVTTWLADAELAAENPRE